MSGKKIVKLLMYLFIFVFLCSYFTYTSGYYEYYLANKRNLTNKQILKFEEDVKKGKNIDVNEYLKENTIDYSNSLTQKTSEVSIKLNEYLRGVIKDCIKVVEKLVR